MYVRIDRCQEVTGKRHDALAKVHCNLVVQALEQLVIVGLKVICSGANGQHPLEIWQIPSHERLSP